MNAWVPRARECGSCTLCCRLLVVDALAKAAGALCPHCTPGQGCGIYARRPDICREYLCGWRMNPGLPEHWRPELSGMIVGRSLDGVPSVIVDPERPDAWRAEPFLTDLRAIAADRATSPGGCVVIQCGAQQTLLYTGREVCLSP